MLSTIQSVFTALLVADPNKRILILTKDVRLLCPKISWFNRVLFLKQTTSKRNTPTVCLFCENRLGHSLMNPKSEAMARWKTSWSQRGPEHGLKNVAGCMGVRGWGGTGLTSIAWRALRKLARRLMDLYGGKNICLNMLKHLLCRIKYTYVWKDNQTSLLKLALNYFHLLVTFTFISFVLVDSFLILFSHLKLTITTCPEPIESGVRGRRNSTAFTNLQELQNSKTRSRKSRTKELDESKYMMR